jgi:ADP-ribose pyrophosphatase YjhB (NUDIX family)
MAWIENQFGEILLLKQKRRSALWTLPGGKVRKYETLETALKRELLEETGLKAASMEPAGMFERPEKANITFLFRTTIKGRETISPAKGEIETAAFSSTLPKDCTPSLAYFWKRHHKPGETPRTRSKPGVRTPASRD